MLLKAQLAVLVLLMALNTWLGIDKELYLSIWWWDILTHFLGGIWAGLFAAWLFKLQKRKITVLQCAFFAVIIGAGWEYFEYAEGLAHEYFMPYWADTLKDLVVDTAGGVSAGFIAIRINKLWRK